MVDELIRIDVCPSDSEWCAYISGELLNGKRRAYQQHLASCRTCFARVAMITHALRNAREQADAELTDPILWHPYCSLAHGQQVPAVSEPSRDVRSAIRSARMRDACGLIVLKTNNSLRICATLSE